MASILRRSTPTRLRAWLRRSALVNATLRRTVGGEQSRPHPRAPFTLYFDGYRSVGWGLGALAEAEAPAFGFAARLIGALRPRCAWDIGANVGFWSLFLAGAQPRIEEIVCFEPDRVNLQWLAKNLDRNGLSFLRVRDVALSDRAGTAVFQADVLAGATGSLQNGQRFTQLHYGAATQPVQVTTSTADDELAAGTPPPQFIKIDVEGHELALLRGASRLLAQHRPALLMEVTEHQQAVGALLIDAKYRMIDPDTGVEIGSPKFMTAALPSERADLLAVCGPRS